MSLQASACGKIILLGEHAVVYGQPAIAIPIQSLRAIARLEPGDFACRLAAPDVGIFSPLDSLAIDQPLAFCVRNACRRMGIPPPSGEIRIESSLPVASGLGSGAAVSTAITRLIALAANQTLAPDEISGLVFEVERLYHGTPSGIDNTVIAWERPIWYIAGEKPRPIQLSHSAPMWVADSGIPGETKLAVGGVRQRWQAEPERYQALFEKIGSLVHTGRAALQAGDLVSLGAAMNKNHECLREMGVSTHALDLLTQAALNAGAFGAKLSGGGLGGHIIALVDDARKEAVGGALRAAGAKSISATALETAK
jgi:mevalonate kinase